MVEESALSWLGELGYSMLSGPEIAPGELLAERDTFHDVILTKRLQAAPYSLNKNIPNEAIDEARRKIMRPEALLSSPTTARFIRCSLTGFEVEYRRPEGSIAGHGEPAINIVR